MTEELKRRRRGEGYRVRLCRVDDERVDFYRSSNERLGNKVEQEGDWLYVKVLIYDLCSSGKTS